MSFGLVQLGQAAASLGEGELVYECLQHLVNRFWLNNLASMHNHRTLFNMDISGGMPAVIIKMLVASEPGRICLLPALSSKFREGSIEGVLCRGQIEIERMDWSKDRVTVQLISQKDQEVLLELPDEINEIKVLSGNCESRAGKDRSSRIISIPEGSLVKIQIGY
jgi:hypothetical protein